MKRAGGGKAIARASSRTLGASKVAARIAGARAQFGFLPPELISACGLLVQHYHRYHQQPSCSAIELVWLSDAHELLRQHEALRTVFEHACRTRRAKPAKERQETVAALILACETLAQDEKGWGARYPEARRSAMQFFAKVSDSRPWLIETYGYPALEG